MRSFSPVMGITACVGLSVNLDRMYLCNYCWFGDHCAQRINPADADNPPTFSSTVTMRLTLSRRIELKTLGWILMQFTYVQGLPPDELSSQS